LQVENPKTEKPLFKDVVEYNAADSIILDVPNKKTFLYKNVFCLEIIFEIQTFEFLATVLEFGFADDRTATVRKTGSISQAVRVTPRES